MKIKNSVERKEKIFFIFLIIIILCFLIDGFTIYKSTIYSNSAKDNRSLENKFTDMSHTYGTLAVQMSDSSIIETLSSIDAYLKWMNEKNITYLESYLNHIQLSTIELNYATSLVYKESDALNESAYYESLASGNEIKSSNINMGLQLMNMAIFFFTLSIYPVRVGIEDTEGKKQIFKKFGIIIFIIGLTMWFLGFIPIFPLLF